MNPPSSPNRALLLTAPAPAAIAIIRILGPNVQPFLAQHFSRPTPPNHCTHGLLRDESHQIIDDPLIVLHNHGADLNLHGGPWVIRSTLDLLSRQGFTLIPNTPGPLPPEALDSPPDTLEAEVEAYLPLARTDLAVRTLLAQPAAWKKLLSAPPSSPQTHLRAILNDQSLYHLLHPPRVAIVGPPNVGKSTLANQLFAQERSIVADLPGTTRDYVGELANIDGLPILLLDTPGQRLTSDPIEQSAIARSAPEIARADLLLLVLDASQPLDPEQLHFLSLYPHATIILNKIDKPFSRLACEAVSSFLPTIASNAHGIDQVRQSIRQSFNCPPDLDPSQPRCWTARQRSLLTTLLAAPR